MSIVRHPLNLSILINVPVSSLDIPQHIPTLNLKRSVFRFVPHRIRPVGIDLPNLLDNLQLFRILCFRFGQIGFLADSRFVVQAAAGYHVRRDGGLSRFQHGVRRCDCDGCH